MLYIHTIKNDQKIGKFFEPTNTEASKDLADSFEKNQDLESIAKNLIAKGKIDKNDGKALMERLKQEEVALTQETRSKLIQLAQANGWVGMKGMIEKTKTHSDIAQGKENLRVQLKNVSDNRDALPKLSDVNQTIQTAVNEETKKSAEAKKAETMKKIVAEIIQANPNIKTIFSDGSKNWTGSNLVADGKNIQISREMRKEIGDKNISYAEITEALNKQLGDKRITEFQANLPKTEMAQVNLESIIPKNTFARRGDTLEKIAKEQGIDVATLLKANPSIKNPNQIAAGTKINFPNFEGTTMVAGKRVDNRATASIPKHTPSGAVSESKITEESRRNTEKQAAEEAQEKQRAEIEAMMRSGISA